jgi:hypothetical protein
MSVEVICSVDHVEWSLWTVKTENDPWCRSDDEAGAEEETLISVHADGTTDSWTS